MWPLTLCVNDRPVLLVTAQPNPFKPAIDLDELRALGVPGWDGDAAHLSARAPTDEEAKKLIHAVEEAWGNGTQPYGIEGGFRMHLDDGLAAHS